MSKSLSNQIDQLIRQVTLPIESRGLPIDPSYVANEVDKLVDPMSNSPDLKTYCFISDVAQKTRKYLAKRHDPIAKMQDALESDKQDDLFGDELQDYYPVKREGKALYIKKEELTEVDVKIICERMRKAGESLIKHANNLEAWHFSKAA